jgi:hypothetical protein
MKSCHVTCIKFQSSEVVVVLYSICDIKYICIKTLKIVPFIMHEWHVGDLELQITWKVYLQSQLLTASVLCWEFIISSVDVSACLSYHPIICSYFHYPFFIVSFTC